MMRAIVAYILFFETVLGVATIFWWWKRCDKTEKIFMLLHLTGGCFFGYTMLL